MRNFCLRVIRDEDGATMVEYALMLMLILFVCIAGVELVGSNTERNFEKCASAWPK